MNYQQTLEYLFSQLPMFQRTGAAAYKANLNNTIEICALLNHPENKFKTVHIAGTNGKGSTSHMLASILQEAGLKVGLYTSPHLKDFRERIKINGKMIPKNAVIHFVKKHQNTFNLIQPSFFEMTVGLAFAYFAKQKVDVAVIETGLGGRLDSTNVINPLLSVITNISFDHINLLGDSLSKIAHEKAGIIKSNIPVVIGETQKEIASIFIEKAKKENANLFFADKTYTSEIIKEDEKYLTVKTINKSTKLFSELKCELKGFYQPKNINTVIQSTELLKKHFLIQEEDIIKGLKKTITNTGLFGRWQTLSSNPLTICDIGHNEAGIKEVIKQINSVSYQKLHFVLGMVNDKDIDKILMLLPKNAYYYFCQADIPRAMDAKELRAKALSFSLLGDNYSSVKEALYTAKRKAGKNDLVFIGGSTFTVAEVI